MTLVDLARSFTRRGGLVAIGSIVALVVGFPLATARAQSPAAEGLFRDGRTLIRQGKLAQGCDKLAASERLESSVGTLLNLGDCREKLGQRASAWAAFRKAEAMAKRAGDDTKRQLEAKKRAATLEGTLASLVLHVTQQPPGLVIHRDGELVDTAVWNTPVPVDPGRYVIVAEAPGWKPRRLEIPIDSTTKQRIVVIPALERAPETASVAVSEAPRAPPPAPPVAAAPSEPTRVQAVATTRRAGTWTAARKLSMGLALGGLGAIGGGVYYGLESKDQQDQANAICPLTLCDSAMGLRLNDDAQRSATRANIFYVAGGAAVAAAAVLWVVGAPSETMVLTPAVGAGQVGVSLAGGF